MKKITLGLLLAGFIVGGTITISSCKKKASDKDTDASAAVDNTTAENTVNDVVNIGSQSIDQHSYTAHRLGTNNGGPLDPMSGQVTVNIDSINTARYLTVTFSNFVGYDGHTRNGTIKYDWSQTTNGAVWFRDSGLVVNATTPNHDYYVDGNKVELSQHTVTNKGRITNGNLTWNVQSNVTITKANNAGTIQWQCTRNTILLNTNATSYGSNQYAQAFTGYSNPINWVGDLLIGYTGSSSGSTSSGGTTHTFTANITSMVVWGNKCSPSSTYPHFHPFIGGSIDFTPSGLTTRNINYGNGSCDAIYTITIGSWSGTYSFI